MEAFFNQTEPKHVAVFALIALWTVFWKGLALWYAARKDHRVWFVVQLVVSTLGILEIIYLFFVLKMKPRELFGKRDSGGNDMTGKSS